MAAIANSLNAESIPPRASRGKGWRSCGIRNILVHPVYKGSQIVNRHYQHISRLTEHLDELIAIQVPPIVAESLWEVVQKRRLDNKHLQPTPRQPWLLQGLIVCGLCGYHLRTG